MKIASSNIGMESARSYRASNYSIKRFETREFSGAFTMGQFSPEGNSNSKLTEDEQPNAKTGKKQPSGTGPEEDKISRTEQSQESEQEQAVNRLKELRDRLLTGRSNFQFRSPQSTQAMQIHDLTVEYIFRLLFDDWKGKLNDFLAKKGARAGSLRQISMVEAYYYQEYEATTFSSQGIVKTADGRELNFNINVSMSRAFEACYAQEVRATMTQVCDPLVINLEGNVAEVSDQNFYFDIDADGELDLINMLGSGSGYVALDKNGNGIIDDGSELFGTKSGDGFADLAAYDEDGNGWIDENDAVWEKLKIWSKAKDGTDKLIDLAEAGVGALYLGNASTDFAHTDENNEAKAFVRNTGVFLYENGGVGTLQHLDMVKYKKEA